MKRFSIASEGYNIDEVNRFIDIVIKRLEKEHNDNLLSQRKISSLEEELKREKEKKHGSDDRISEAILAAQSASDRMRTLAREEAKMIVEEARNNANSIVHEALLTAEKTEMEANLLRKNVTVYKDRIKNIIKAQLELADELDKYDLSK